MVYPFLFESQKHEYKKKRFVRAITKIPSPLPISPVKQWILDLDFGQA